MPTMPTLILSFAPSTRPIENAAAPAARKFRREVSVMGDSITPLQEHLHGYVAACVRRRWDAFGRQVLKPDRLVQVQRRRHPAIGFQKEAIRAGCACAFDRMFQKAAPDSLPLMCG